MTDQQLQNKLTELLSLPDENEVVEFKEAKNGYDFNKLGRYFCALSNEANLKNKEEAWLIFGIDKNHKIVGSQFRSQNRAHLDSLKGEISQRMAPRITFIEIYELNTPEGRVVMFQIPAAPKGIPIACDGHFWGRDGEQLVALNLDEIERIRKQVAHFDWSEAICAGATVDDLDEKAIAIARENYKIKNPRLANEIDAWDNIVFLNKAKITINGKITRTAIILLGKSESEHYLSPGIARITWILRDKENVEKDYAHFSCPFILAVDEVFAKIRILKYRYIKDGTLFPDEVDQYDPFNIKEALSNCIAHQDYSLAGRINVVEREDGQLVFSNLGEFLPGSIESVIASDEPQGYYRNNFLAQAMVNLNMIDTVGSGIKRMFRLQRERFFPMPDFELDKGKVKATIIGKVLDIEYARVLARHPDLTLEEIIILDKVQKKKELDDEEIEKLRKRKLIEGRKPNFIISENLAIKTKQVGAYLKTRGFDKVFYKKLAYEFIKKNKDGTSKTEIRDLLWSKLPDVLDDSQKETKISNILSELRIEGNIKNIGNDAKPNWIAVNWLK